MSPDTCEGALLALDTSTERMAVAACAGGRESVHLREGGARASAELIGVALERLQACGIAVDGLDAIAFGAGPGAFTGLRTACAVAQGWAIGAGCPVLPIDSLQIVAEDARLQRLADGADPSRPTLFAVAMDARMEEVYAAAYRWDGRDWSIEAEPLLCRATDLADRWPGAMPDVWSGNAAALAGGAARWSTVPRVEHERDRAGALLRLARRAWARGLARDAAEAAPVYLRDKVALTVAERAALPGR